MRHQRSLVAGVSRSLLLLASVAPGGSLWAEDAKPIAVSRLLPAGGQVGTTVDVTASGNFPTWPVEVWTDRGTLDWQPQEEAGHFRVTIPPNESLGLHQIRFHDRQGATVVKPFVVGPVAESSESEPNNTRMEATLLENLPLTVNGVLEKAGDVDCFGVHLQAGETIVAALTANRVLASPMDAVLDLVDEGGAYLARNLDATGLDPRLAYTAVRDGLHIVRVYGFPSTPNSSIQLAGSENSLYRLTVTKNGFLSGCLPTVAAASPTTPLAACGWDLPTGLTLPALVASPPLLPGSTSWLGVPGIAGLAEVSLVENVPIFTATTAAANADPLRPPFLVSGQFREPEDSHTFRVALGKDEKLQLQLASQTAGFEADPLLVIRDQDGTVRRAKQEREASGSWTAPAEGVYAFSLRDRRGRAGPGYLYRLAVLPERPSVSVSVAADQFTTQAGKDLSLEINVGRQFGFADTVTVSLTEAPDGVTAESVTSTNEGDAAKKVSLTLKATAPTSGRLRLVATHTVTSDNEPKATLPVTFGTASLLDAWLTVLPAEEKTKESDE